MKRLSLLLILLAACSRHPAHDDARHVDPAPCRGPSCTPATDPAPEPEPLTWQPATGPGSYGLAAGLYVHGDRIVMSGYGRVLLSDDGGASWAVRTTPVGQLFDVVESNGAILVDDTFTGEVYRSLDGGTSWQPIVSNVVDFARRGSEFWVTSFEDGALVARHSADGGSTWKALGPGTPMDVIPGEGNVLVGHQQGVGIFYSDDAGASWTEVPRPNGGSSQAIAYWKGHIVATYDFGDGTGDHGIGLTADMGKSWIARRLKIVEGWRSWVTATPDGLFAVTAVGEVLRLKAPDGQWEVLLPFEGHGGNRIDAAWGGEQGLYIVLDGDLVRWDEGRHRFVRAGKRPILSSVPALASDGEELWAVVSANEIHRSVDGGRTWKLSHQPTVDLDNISDVVAQDGVVWIGTGFDGVFRSDDGGESWTSLEDRLPQVNGQAGEQAWGVTDLLLDDTGLYYATAALEFAGGTDGNFVSTGLGVLFSDDGGDTWGVLDSGLPPGKLGRRSPTGPMWEAGGVLFTATNAGMFRSEDRGRSWKGPATVAGEEPNGALLAGVVEREGRLLGAFRLAEGPFGGLFASDDRGATWTPEGGALPGPPISLVDTHGLLVLLVDPGMQGAVVWSSEDAGATWKVLGEDAPAAGLTLLATEHELLLGTPGQGVSRLPLDSLKLP